MGKSQLNIVLSPLEEVISIMEKNLADHVSAADYMVDVIDGLNGFDNLQSMAKLVAQLVSDQEADRTIVLGALQNLKTGVKRELGAQIELTEPHPVTPVMVEGYEEELGIDPPALGVIDSEARTVPPANPRYVAQPMPIPRATRRKMWPRSIVTALLLVPVLCIPTHSVHLNDNTGQIEDEVHENSLRPTVPYEIAVPAPKWVISDTGVIRNAEDIEESEEEVEDQESDMKTHEDSKIIHVLVLEGDKKGEIRHLRPVRKK